jgi:membrane-associated phospholipid phosphatase
VGWARLEDDQHWLSDVAAGAALGWWTARKVDRLLRERDGSPAGSGARYGLIFSPRRGHTRLGVRVRF